MTASTVTAGRTLRPVTGRGWRLGFGNMLANENRRWWGTRRWLVQLLLFVALINGMVLIVSVTGQGVDPAEGLTETVDVFMGMLIMVTAIGVVVIAQGAIISEKQLGTAAWVMSKPASRSGFVLAKLIAYAANLLLLAIPVPTAIFYVEAQVFWGQVPDPVGLLPALALLVLQFGFYLALTLMLGTLCAGRGPVAGIGIGLLIGGLVLGNTLPLLPYVLPWPLPDLAIGALMGRTAPAAWPIPVIATAGLSVVFVVVALWRFSREEF
jgi:ABC-2 type transport system permease protein